ncbi:MAG: LysR family transcriptional regulator [Oscillospiraceae bacterium]
MDINKLEYFLCVCKYLNFSKAAEELYVTAQGLNVAISRMEKDLNTKLFMRTSKGLVLTDSGFRLKETAETIVGEFNNYQTRLHNKDTIYVASMHYVYTALPVPVQRLLMGLEPGHQVKFSEHSCENCEALLLRGEIDFAIATPFISNSEFLVRKLFTARIAVLVNSQSPYAGEDLSDMRMLDGVKMLTTSKTSKTYLVLMAHCQEKSVAPKIMFEVYHPSSIIGIVRSNPDIVGVFPEYFLNGMDLEGLRIFYLHEADIDFDLSLIKNVSRVQSNRAMSFEQHLFSLMRSAHD